MLFFLWACNPTDPKSDSADVTTVTQEADPDGDGFTTEDGDCDDNNAAIHPDATEECNEIDDNCDGAVDEGVLSTWYADTDGDGYGDPGAATTACTQQDGQVAEGGDCDDTNLEIHPGAAENCDDTVDKNCDGTFGDADADQDGVVACLDCDDNNAAVYPGASERCDAANIDEDCDGNADDADTSVDATTKTTFYADRDADGYGAIGSEQLLCDGTGPTLGGDCDDTDTRYNPAAVESCDDPNDYNCDGSVGYADTDGDGFAACSECDDGNAAIYPGTTEVCNGVDDNCDGAVDDGAAAPATWYADVDGDGFGDLNYPQQSCTMPAGSVANADDCDDASAERAPGTPEACDGLDNDCDGIVDNDAVDATSWYADTDGDGYGDAAALTRDCTAPAGSVADDRDCDDGDAARYPGNPEICDELDNDCDSVVDNGAADANTWYTDADADGWGDLTTGLSACDAPAGTVSDAGDCDDQNAAQYPGNTEVCDGLDNDCDGNVDGGATDAFWSYADGDGDGAGDLNQVRLGCTLASGDVLNASDCDDQNQARFPGNPEVCDGIDNDCDGVADVGASDAFWAYADADGDGAGDPATSSLGCTLPTGYVQNTNDCDDQNAARFVGNPEICDNLDNDCDGNVDTGASDARTWYADGDGDGSGDPTLSVVSCAAPSGYILNAGDCDDTNAKRFPLNPEICDGIDNDCNGTVDDNASDALPWYADTDGDGYGDVSIVTYSCTAPVGTTSVSTDCNDTDAAVHPGATETWYDGVDQNCDQANDYDQDQDGDMALPYGGADCDDLDATRYGGYRCRPTVYCTHAAAATIASKGPSGASDIAFNSSCTAYVSTVVSGTDYVYAIDSGGNRTVVTGYSNYNISAISLLSDGRLVVSHNDNSHNGIGIQNGNNIQVLTVGSYTSGSLWANTYHNQNQSSLYADSAGCVWSPNFLGNGTLVCVDASTKAATTLANLGSRIEGVGADSSGDLLVSVGAKLMRVDSSGASSVYYTFSSSILDFVVDYNDDVYAELIDNTIVRLEDYTGGASVYATVSGDGKLAITPDGWLFRLQSNPSSAGVYAEWRLGN